MFILATLLTIVLSYSNNVNLMVTWLLKL